MSWFEIPQKKIRFLSAELCRENLSCAIYLAGFFVKTFKRVTRTDKTEISFALKFVRREINQWLSCLEDFGKGLIWGQCVSDVRRKRDFYLIRWSLSLKVSGLALQMTISIEQHLQTFRSRRSANLCQEAFLGRIYFGNKFPRTNDFPKEFFRPHRTSCTNVDQS